MRIKSISAREVLDSRGLPTVEVDIQAGDYWGREMVPSGKSTGRHEALELRDGGKRFLGKGVSRAVKNIREIIAPKLIGISVTNQEKIDRTMIELDGTLNKSRLGANSIMGVSLACARTAAICKKMHFFEYFAQMNNNRDIIIPTPFMNIINGGAHANNTLDFQEYMIVPSGKSFAESMQIASEVYYMLKKQIVKKYGPFNVNIGDEGGFCPNIDKYYKPMDLIMDAIEKLGYEKKVKIAIDAAASEFFRRGKYEFDGKRLDANGMMEVYEDLVNNYPLVSIEDPFHEDAFDDFAYMMKRFQGKKLNIVGDDLLCTQIPRMQEAIRKKSCSALLLKVNQVGTITESIEAAKLAITNNWDVMVSHRSGETEDHFIADFAVGLSTGMIKAGAPCRGERTAKYNQLLRIEEKLGANCRYPGTTCIRSC